MPKFRIRLKVQALELEIDGEREDIPAITAAVQQQLTGLVQPAESTVDGHKDLHSDNGPIVDAELIKAKSKSGKKRNRPNSDAPAAQPIDFRHNAAKYGSPQQSWNSTDKSLWLLYVLDDLGVAKEITGPQLAATFNHHFKAAKTIHPPLVTRELAKIKLQTPAFVGEDKKQDPSLWYLTNEGKIYIQQLIKGVLNPA